MNYFGTSLTSSGHYMWELDGISMKQIGLFIRELPFDPEKMPNDGKGGTPKGFSEFKNIGEYSILAIAGSCIDRRDGTKSVFFIKEKVDKGEMISRIKSIPIAAKIIEALPFKIIWND